LVYSDFFLPTLNQAILRRNVFPKLLIAFLSLLLGSVEPVFADGDQLEALGFTEKSGEALASTPRTPRPSSKISENVTVITAADIERLNAHTIAEVLQTVPGIQLEYLRTPSTAAFFSIQGAHNTTIMVLIDGIRQNNADQAMAIPGLIPVQQIERIEIIKGAASSSWGPALGGVINIITKTPNPERAASGMVSGSVGSKFTADSRVELSGSKERFGYYMTIGNLRSDGLTPNTGTNLNNLYGKLSYMLPGNGTVAFGLSKLTARPGLDEGDTVKWGFVHDNNEFNRFNGFLKYNQPLGRKLTLDIDSYFTSRDDHTKYGGRDDQGGIVFFNDYNNRDKSRGVNSRLLWGDSQTNLVTGFEYGRNKASNGDNLSSDPPFYDRSWDSWALYANGTYSIGSLAILPGIRYDANGIANNNTSYMLGANYRLTESTLLRVYSANGFSLPNPNFVNTALQKIITIQGGIESEVVPYLWLKGTYFYNTLRSSQSVGAAIINNQERQGFELEARTVPLYGLSLTSSYTFLYAKNSDTKERLQTNSDQTVPPHTVKLALNYDKSDLGLRGTLTGNYVWWNSPADYPSRSTGMIWDLHLNWKLKTDSKLSPELFFSGHNLLNGVQTTDTTLYNNAPRWFEGGVRVNF